MSSLEPDVSSLGHSMPDSTAKLTIFISYVHEDFGIAGALNNLIQNAFGTDIAVFIDKVSIQQGENIRAAVDMGLAKADILAVVSTGAGGPRYWAGYEIGYFQASHQSPPTPEHPLWGNLISFCSTGNSPGPINEYKHVALGFDDSELEKSQDEFDARLKIADDEPLFLWFSKLFAAVQGVRLEERKGLQSTYKSIISGFWKVVFAEFKQRPKFEFKPQKQLKIRLNSALEHGSGIRADGEITLLGYAHNVFGIRSQASSRTIKWKDFCAELANADRSLAPFWTGTLVRILARAGRADSLDEVSGNLLWSQSERKLFRLILTTYTTFYNGTIDASIYIVEVLRRPDHGDPGTTLLAKGLQSAMRFRSLFLEENGLFNYLNIAYSRDGLPTVAADIVAELDFLTMDLIASDMQTPSSWNGILTAEEIEKMTDTWQPLRKRLLEGCQRAMAANEDAVETAKSELAVTLREIGAKVGPINDRVLKAIAAKLVDIAEQAAAKRTHSEH